MAASGKEILESVQKRVAVASGEAAFVLANMTPIDIQANLTKGSKLALAEITYIKIRQTRWNGKGPLWTKALNTLIQQAAWGARQRP